MYSALPLLMFVGVSDQQKSVPLIKAKYKTVYMQGKSEEKKKTNQQEISYVCKKCILLYTVNRPTCFGVCILTYVYICNKICVNSQTFLKRNVSLRFLFKK